MTRILTLLMIFGWLMWPSAASAADVASPQISPQISPQTPPQTPPQIVLKSQSEVMGEMVRLSDIFDGIDPAQDRVLGPAPAPGLSRTYDVMALARLANAFHLPWRAASMGDKLIVTRASQTISLDDMRTALLEALKDQGVQGDLSVDMDQRITDIKIPADITANLRVATLSYDPTSQRLSADLRMAENTSAAKHVQISGRVRVMQDIPVLARAMNVGEAITAADLNWVKVPSDRVQGVIVSAEQLVGQELRRNINEGQPVRLRDVIAPRLVKRGQLVTMQVKAPGMMITARGAAQQDGSAGDVIRLQNTTSKRVVQGIVQMDGSVVVETIMPTLAQNTYGQNTREQNLSTSATHVMP